MFGLLYSCVCFVHVSESIQTYKKKYFTHPQSSQKKSTDTYNLTANELMLECRVRGQPRPVISWSKDGDFIVSDDKYQQLDQADGTCKLIISNPEERDSGTYACSAENSLFSDKITHNVVFDGQNKYMLEKTYGFFHRDPNKPQIQNPLGDHLVTAGGTIGLQAEVIHSPTEVQWLCDKAIIRPSKTVKTLLEHGVYTLVLNDAASEHSGTYTCRAINAFGRVESHAHVHVVGPKVENGKCPLFSPRPEAEMKIMTGDPFSISFKLIGEPKPKCTYNTDISQCMTLESRLICFYVFCSGLHEGNARSHHERTRVERSIR